MKFIRIDGRPTLNSYQCLDCKEITTAEGKACTDSYFEWLMSRPTSKRAVAF